jgi:hypothetical protein
MALGGLTQKATIATEWWDHGTVTVGLSAADGSLGGAREVILMCSSRSENMADQWAVILECASIREVMVFSPEPIQGSRSAVICNQAQL